jgi:C-terminal processing protease CtpA/Prc
MSSDARTYLDHAIALFREAHINASKMDWPALTAEAYSAAAGAKTTADTYPAIWLIIKELGEKHTSFLTPDQAKADTTGKPSGTSVAPPFQPPDAKRVTPTIGMISLHGFMGSADQGQQYAQDGKDEILHLKAEGVCKFVLDLRDDTGGNMYPMINSVSGLLKNGVLGFFENSAGQYIPWVLENGTATMAPVSSSPPKSTVNNVPEMPIAVLIGPKTASAGEFTAMSFEGRPNTRFFGESSGGYVTANTPVPLGDGAMIAMTVGWGLDRTGKKYTDRIEPDTKTGDGAAALDAAVKWLSHQPCLGRRPRR